MQAKRLAGIADADETFIRRSYKGSRSLERPPRQRGGGAKKSRKGRDPDDEVGVLVMRDREGHTLSHALETVDHRTIDDTVGHRLEREAVLCTDGASVYQRYAQYRGVTHEPVNLAQGIAYDVLRFICKTSMRITADGKAGWTAFTAWRLATSTTIWAGIECSTPLATQSHRMGYWPPLTDMHINTQR